MKRFYRHATASEVTGGWQVTLDGRAVKTQKGAPQLLPNRMLAAALAGEWNNQGARLDPKSFPMRDLADVAIDLIAPARDDAITKLLAFADTDTLCYRAEPDEPLFHRQRQVWDPILESLERREGITLQRVHGIAHKAHPEASMAQLRSRLETQDNYALAALMTMASLAASLTIALEAIQPAADGETLWNAANLEEDWQVEQWGEDEQAAARREKRKREFLSALEFAKAARA